MLHTPRLLIKQQACCSHGHAWSEGGVDYRPVVGRAHGSQSQCQQLLCCCWGLLCCSRRRVASPRVEELRKTSVVVLGCPERKDSVRRSHDCGRGAQRGGDARGLRTQKNPTDLQPTNVYRCRCCTLQPLLSLCCCPPFCQPVPISHGPAHNQPHNGAFRGWCVNEPVRAAPVQRGR